MLTSSLLLKAYQAGVFPMSDGRADDSVFWVRPEIRGIFPMAQLHISKSTRRFIKKTPYYVTVDKDFSGTVAGCIASRSEQRTDTWINHDIETVFLKLHQQGYAHSFETRDSQGVLIGGLYGMAIGGAFFGESMFSNVTGASKFSLIACYAYLKERNFQLFDTQYNNSHLKLFGCIDITHNEYDILLKQAISCNVSFNAPPPASIIKLTEY
ncbi:MAG: leucyl/phenylalanyl-tRNA--protein transferase [Dasania sp.]|jgi:leucyl/phenylalanyl-tRNA--protein transferase